MKRVTRYLVAAILAVPMVGGILSCSEEADCSMNARPSMQCNFYYIDPTTEIEFRDTLELLTVTALGTDSVIVNAKEEARDVALPLRYAADSTVLVFHYADATRDTLIVRHTNTPYFLSMDCGFQMKQAVNSVSYTRHVLDSIHISNAETDIYGTENLKLYY